VLGSDATGSPRFEPLDFPAVFLTLGSRWAVGQVRHGDETDLSLFVAPAAELGTPGITWTPVCGRDDMVTAFAIRGDEIHLLTSRGAPRGRVVRTSLAHPDLASAAIVYEPESALADAVAIAADAVYVGITDRPTLGVVRVPHDEPAQAMRLTIGDDERSVRRGITPAARPRSPTPGKTSSRAPSSSSPRASRRRLGSAVAAAAPAASSSAARSPTGPTCSRRRTSGSAAPT